MRDIKVKQPGEWGRLSTRSRANKLECYAKRVRGQTLI
nr:MAG TPA: hypothetical protein [Caudoviricetes sp.]